MDRYSIASKKLKSVYKPKEEIPLEKIWIDELQILQRQVTEANGRHSPVSAIRRIMPPIETERDSSNG